MPINITTSSERCPFIALCEQQKPAKRGKQLHEAKPKNRAISQGPTHAPATSGNVQPNAANVSFSAC
jgi:hypothetical protein